MQVTRGIGEKASWHAQFAHSAYVFAGGLPYELTEGDVLAIFAQYGEIVDVHLVRDKETGKVRRRGRHPHRHAGAGGSLLPCHPASLPASCLASPPSMHIAVDSFSLSKLSCACPPLSPCTTRMASEMRTRP